jgi:hypothetical protein
MSPHAAVVAWLLMAINAWGASPAPAGESTDEVRQHAAESIVAVAYDAYEPPVYQGAHGRARTAVLLASISGLESRFAENVIAGHCYSWQCDSHNGVAQATGLMQVHAGRYGVRLVGDGAALCATFGADCYLAQELVANVSLQVRAGLHIYRTQGPRAYTTGLAAIRQANEWVATHAPPAADVDVMQEQLAER